MIFNKKNQKPQDKKIDNGRISLKMNYNTRVLGKNQIYWNVKKNRV